MNCPKCNIEMNTFKSNGLNIQYCKSCKALWVKFPVLQKIGEMLNLKSSLINPADMEKVNVKENARICPDCGKNMDKVYFNGIIVDKCSGLQRNIV